MSNDEPPKARPDKGDLLMMLYKHYSEELADAPKSVEDMTPEERKAYMRDAQRRSRERVKKAKESGCPEPTTANVRQALADAALLILKADGPGADVVMSTLARAFPGKIGVPATVKGNIRHGKLKTKMVKDGA